MIESFWKKCWFEIIISIIFFVAAIVLVCFGQILSGVIYLVSGLSWYFCALTSYHTEQIKALAYRVAELEAEAITDIDEESPGYYMVKRRLGPDKE